ncbi:MAG: tetratricopeptide repeat protein [Bacteroidales bacterium]
MTMWIGIMTILSFIANAAFSSFDSIDSLQALVKKQSDDEKLRTMVLLMNELARKQPAEALEFFPEALAEADRQSNRAARAEILLFAGLANNSLGKLYDQINLHEEALQIAVALNDSAMQAKTLTMISMAYWGLGQYDKSLDLQLQSLNLRLELGDKKQILAAYNNLGIIYQRLDQDNEALQCYLKALSYYDDETQLFGNANLLNNIGSLYSKQGRHDSAVIFFNQALDMNLTLQDTRGQALNYLNLGIDYSVMGKLITAEQSLIRSLKLFRDIQDRYGMASAMKQLAFVWDARGNNSRALGYIDSSRHIASEIGARDLERDILLLASKIHENQNDYSEALKAFKEHAALRDSIFSDNQMERINELKTRFEMAEKERANQLLQKELEVKQLTLKRKQDLQYVMIGLLFVFVIIGVLIFLAYKQKYRALVKEKELNRLKSRFISTVSHEFRTPLAGIYSSTQLLQSFHEKWTQEEKGKLYGKIYDSIMHLKKMLDEVMVIDKGQDKRLEVNPVVVDLPVWSRQVMEDTISTHDRDVKINIEIEPSIQRVHIDKNLMQHIFANLLSNAIKYSGDFPVVNFRVEKENGMLRLSISDNGIGIDPDDMKYIFDDFHRGINVGTIQGTGLGMSIVKNCVALIGGDIKIDSELEKGTTVTVTIPYSDV